MSIFVRTVPNVMRYFNCTADDARRYIDLRDEGYGTFQAALMAGLTDPADERFSAVQVDEPKCNKGTPAVEGLGTGSGDRGREE